MSSALDASTAMSSTISTISSTITQDWKYPRTAKAFANTDYTNPSSTILRCITNSRIPCTSREFASMGTNRFTMTVLGLAKLGWAKAPYKKAAAGKKVQQDPNAKALFEVVRNDGGVVSGIRFYSFKKAKSNFDRDDHDASINAVLNVGQVMTFYIHSFMFDKKNPDGTEQSIFPRDNDMQFIPEFTIVDMRIMTSHNDTDMGYGCKLQKLSIHHTSLYSYMGSDSLHLLPETFLSASDLAVQRASENPFIRQQMEARNVAFFAYVPAKAFISSVPITEEFFRMVGPNGGELFPGVPCVDIAKVDLLKYANAVGDGEDDVYQAITLLDIASCASSLAMYVVGTQGNYSKSKDPALGDFRGVPLVDVDKFLKSVDFESADGEEVVMRDRVIFPFRSEIVGFGDGVPCITVFTKPVLDVFGKPAPCPDFSLLSEELSVGKGYTVTIGTKEIPDIVKVIFNVMGCMSSAAGTPVRLDYASQTAKRLEKKRKLLELSAEGGSDAESGAASPQ